MISIVCFELIPEAIELSNLVQIFLWILIGVAGMIFCDQLVNKIYYKKEKIEGKSNSLLKTGIIVGIGLAIHNFPEGLAIGSGFEASAKLGLSLALAIAVHDVPEGISMSVPMKAGGMKASKALLYTAISGITTGIGAFFGGMLGNISQTVIACCLAFAAGAMLYIASRRINPRIKQTI